MIKADLAQIVYETHGGVSFREAVEMVDLILDRIKLELGHSSKVKLTGFGSFHVVERKGRVGRNPQTGEKIRLAPSRQVTFRVSRRIGL